MTLLRISNKPLGYSWGSRELMADFLGLAASGEPMAEVWFGTHPVSPTAVVDTANGTLRDRLGKELPYLVKFLAAEKPLSIQAHPTLEHARRQFAIEASSGLPASDSMRNYKDANHKPELLVALSEFRALVGFRSTRDSLDDLAALESELPALGELARALEGGGYRAAMDWIFAEFGGRRALATENVPAPATLGKQRSRLIEQLGREYPNDPGQLVALLMNLVTLAPGQAIFVAAGEIHAYLSGLGIEVMAASDNVLRGGLTPKRVDVPELMRVLNFDETLNPILNSTQLANGVFGYSVPVADFSCTRLEPDGTRTMPELKLDSAAIAACTSGRVELTTSLGESVTLQRGDAAFIGDEAKHVSVFGSGTLFLVTTLLN
jgi:mannose-6-phosphate isomerase